ncbi:hypothetical protein KNE206_17690 [Kitasatospora sp. NE20-6]
MGTAIVATGAAAVRPRVPGAPGLVGLAEVAWLLAVLALAALGTASAVRLLHRRRGPRPARDPAAAVFHGCPPMALISVGSATLSVGARLVGTGPAAAAGLALWTVGTLHALAVAAAVPYLMITRRAPGAPVRADPTWLLPVVAPLVAAAAGPALLPHLPAAWRPTALLGCCGLFGAGLLGVLLVLPAVVGGLWQGGLPQGLTPSLFLVLGPLGQSATAAGALADVVGPAAAGPARRLSVAYGVAVLGFALLWLCVAGGANLRAVRAGMPFAMTWWAWTFPVGTLVTGTAALARHTGLAAFTGAAVLLYVLLLAAWGVAGTRTLAALAVTGVRR